MNYIITSTQNDPYLNLAVENYFVDNFDADGVLLYIWVNSNVVVIGQHQNPFAECDLDAMSRMDVKLMRRRTGGGAVFHDIGNVNFSFVAPAARYDVSKHFDVIKHLLAFFGLSAEVSGRNDMVCDGRKFSGSAFSRGNKNMLHHGTLLIQGDMSKLQRCLSPDPAKLARHGVQSVRSRVVNLAELNSAVTPHSVKQALPSAFAEVYGDVSYLSFADYQANDTIVQLSQHLQSDEWLYGRWRNFSLACQGSFDWGQVKIDAVIDADRRVIRSVNIASDCLFPEAIALAQAILPSLSIDNPPLLSDNMPSQQRSIIFDIFNLVKSLKNEI